MRLIERRDGKEYPLHEEVLFFSFFLVKKHPSNWLCDQKVKWRDGSFENDVPTIGLSEMFNASFFIVSQTNPRTHTSSLK